MFVGYNADDKMHGLLTRHTVSFNMPLLTHKKRKQFARYQFAIAAFNSSKRAVELLQAGEFPHTHPANEHLFTSLVVTYFRPFTENCGIGPLKEEEIPPGSKKIHCLLKRLRNETFGHTDALTEFDTGEKTNRLMLEVETGAVHFSSSRISFGSDILSELSSHLDRMIDVCERGLDSIYEEFDLSSLPIGDFIVNIEKDSDELLIPRNSES